jgi:hypothetical protein
MICFALVRTIEDIPRASREIGILLSMHRKQRPANSAQHLLGIWVHRRMVAQPPSSLVRIVASEAVCRYQVVQTTSLSGIWTLCWLEPAPPASALPSQQELLDCLRATAGEDAGNGSYIPIFTTDSKLAEALKLRDSCPESVQPPLFWDSEKGRFSRVRLVRQTPGREKQSG